MPSKLRPILLALILAGASLGAAGCGGDSAPDPSIPAETATTLAAKLQEIQANVDNGSCLVAADRTDDLISDIDDLPSTVNDDVRQALQNGANNLKLLLADPTQCEGRTTTTAPATTTQQTSTVETTTTTRSQPTTTRSTPTQTQTQTTPSVTQTIPTTPGSPSGGVGPGGL